MPEPMYQCPNCKHICTESQAMLTQGVCKPCDIGGKGEFCLDDLPPEEVKKEERPNLLDYSDVAQDIAALCRGFKSDVLSLIGLNRFLEVMAHWVHAGATKKKSGIPGLDVVFHGTGREHLPIIRESGLITPDGVYHKAKNGQVLGKGVYASASWQTASGYGDAILVCLAVPGVRGTGIPKEVDMKRGKVFSYAPDRRIVYSYEGQVLPLVAVNNKREALEVKELVMQAKEAVESAFGANGKDETLFLPDIW
mmetsp:Transcript_33585/g.50788  ORF Transcript_33585/g.50788 Transcript_33585/m.50788 type:complete len:252 (+) Transcript_33585:147-902(+)